MKTRNAYIFSWDMYGIESIVSIGPYEAIDKNNIFKILKNEKPIRNPLNSIIQSLILRARFNPQRHYEIYSVDCAEGIDIKFWQEQWESNPQLTAELIRERGVKIYSDRATDNSKVRIR